jgi:hypothetical protein
MTLDGHVKSSMEHWAQDELTQSSCSAVLRTWERRLDNQHGKLVVPLRALRTLQHTFWTPCTVLSAVVSPAPH